jgi:hypothetical protein
MTAFRPDPDVLFRRVGDELVLVHAGRNEIYSLNTTGGRLWELLSGGCTRAEAAAQLATEFDVTEEAAAQEADALLDQLSREGLLHVEGS